MIEYFEYKGFPMVRVTVPNSKKSIQFGEAKARAILAHIDEIRAWVDELNEYASCHEVTCPDCGDTWVWAADMADMPYAPKEYTEAARCPACKDADKELTARLPLAGVELPDLSLPQLPAGKYAEIEPTAKNSAFAIPATPKEQGGLVLQPGTMPGSTPRRNQKPLGMFTDQQTAGPKPQGNGKLIELGQSLELKAQDFRTAEEKEEDQHKAEAELNYTLPGLGDDNGAAKVAANVRQLVEDAHLQERREAYAEKRQARIDRLNRKAQGAKAAGNHAFEQAHKMASVIPFGQPILVGHHSEKSDRSYRRRIEGKYRKGAEMLDAAEEYERRAKAAERNDAVYADDPDGADKLRVKLAEAQKFQENMKAANKIVRSKATDEEKIAKLADLLDYSPAKAASLLRKDFAGRVGFPDYAIRNNGANIRRLGERIAELEKMQTEPTTERIIGDVRIVRNGSNQRLQMFFPGKPDEDTRFALKQNGFHWSKTDGAWQRQLSNQAEWAAERVLGVEYTAVETLVEMKKASWQACTAPAGEQIEYRVKWSTKQLAMQDKAKQTLDDWFGR